MCKNLNSLQTVPAIRFDLQFRYCIFFGYTKLMNNKRHSSCLLGPSTWLHRMSLTFVLAFLQDTLQLSKKASS